MRVIHAYATALLVLLLAIPASADWQWGVSAASTALPSPSWSAVGYYGSKALAADGYDFLDLVQQPGQKALIGTYHANGQNGWSGPDGFYKLDMVGPIAMVEGETRSWTVHVWADQGLPVYDDEQIRVSWIGTYLSSSFQYDLTLTTKPNGITDGPAVGTTWDLSLLQSQDPTSPKLFYLPMFRTANGLEGYAFDFTATYVPEPSSLLALLAGLSGVGGMVWKRRR